MFYFYFELNLPLSLRDGYYEFFVLNFESYKPFIRNTTNTLSADFTVLWLPTYIIPAQPGLFLYSFTSSNHCLEQYEGLDEGAVV